MPRKPFLPTYTGAPWAIGINVAKDRPESMKLIAECVTMWPFVEHQMAILLGLLLGSNTPASIAVFSSMRNSRSQRDAILAAADSVFDDAEYELIEASLSAFRTAERKRNDIAHGNWGISPEISDGLIWVEAKHHGIWNTAVLASETINAPRPEHSDLAKKFFVYTNDDLKEDIETIRQAWRVGFNLVSYVRWRPGHPQTREQIYDQISMQPLVAQALSHLRKARRN